MPVSPTSSLAPISHGTPSTLGEIGPVGPYGAASGKASSAARDSTPGGTRGEPAERTHAGDEPSPFARVLVRVGHALDTGERAMRAATAANAKGRDLGPDELLALQAGVYRYSETVDLAAKLVDKSTSGVKTVLQGQ